MRRASAVALRARLDSVASRLLKIQQQKNFLPSSGNSRFSFFFRHLPLTTLYLPFICPLNAFSNVFWEKVRPRAKKPQKGLKTLKFEPLDFCLVFPVVVLHLVGKLRCQGLTKSTTKWRVASLTTSNDVRLQSATNRKTAYVHLPLILRISAVRPRKRNNALGT